MPDCVAATAAHCPAHTMPSCNRVNECCPMPTGRADAVDGPCTREERQAQPHPYSASGQASSPLTWFHQKRQPRMPGHQCQCVPLPEQAPHHLAPPGLCPRPPPPAKAHTELPRPTPCLASTRPAECLAVGGEQTPAPRNPQGPPRAAADIHSGHVHRDYRRRSPTGEHLPTSCHLLALTHAIYDCRTGTQKVI